MLSWLAVCLSLFVLVQNIHDRQARHLMALTRNNAALDLLFDRGVLEHGATTVRHRLSPCVSTAFVT